MMTDVIDRKAAIDALMPIYKSASLRNRNVFSTARKCMSAIEELPSAQPERLTDDDFETIRIHLNAYKEKLCNQQRWEEANEYQRIIDRFMSFASAQPEQRLSCKNCIHLGHGYMMPCKNCKRNQMLPDWYEMETERKKND